MKKYSRIKNIKDKNLDIKLDFMSYFYFYYDYDELYETYYHKHHEYDDYDIEFSYIEDAYVSLIGGNKYRRSISEYSRYRVIDMESIYPLAIFRERKLTRILNELNNDESTS